MLCIFHHRRNRQGIWTGISPKKRCRWLVSIWRRRQWHPTAVLLPGKSYGWRSLVGCSPWGRWESDRTERPYFHFSLSCIGEGNGNPLQCSCLENPTDGGAWWAAVSGVAQSRTRLKWLSSSSSSKHMKSCPISSVSQELQIKMRCHYMSFRMMKIQKAVKTKSWQGCD